MARRYAAVAITRNGIRLALKLGGLLADTEVYCYAKYSGELEEIPGERRIFDGPVKELLPGLFRGYEAVILFFSLGAAVRLMAPLLESKLTDPAVIVIDEGGQHVISVLSGHLGGANRLTLEIAGLLHSHPVITTASDVQGVFAADLLGREFGWRLEDFAPAKGVSAALVNGEPVAVLQEAGETGWLPPGAVLPVHVRLCSDMAELLQQPLRAAVIITDRLLKPAEAAALSGLPAAVYRPRSLVLGLGCNRGTAAAELEAAVLETLEELRLSPLSVRGAATITIKGNEAGLLELCGKFGWELDLYTAEQLNTVPLDQPSAVVFKATGAYGVCEPAAILSAGGGKLLQPKKKSGNVTIAVARAAYGGREEQADERTQ
ncbi:cobalt-precorrin 5A hydrolase [Paenibacillus sp. FSL R7-0331]|uniref:cobalt-precorrin 5A hydrolase n=1 Tax=Paenibacillus sp. FSL R7-0331 TaxID=1536773 RepID=UPI0004F7A9B0|nr:cobalamin biosynthesis protein [Paenibacillus sp. FSL R7-0331]AIQ51693.1 cobalamin biosynthesis protein CbiG [Paenibacillus sp. FSL R7-0331]